MCQERLTARMIFSHMTLVKLIAKPNTWFKEGTEVFNYDEYGVRFTLDEYKKWEESGTILARGLRVCEDASELRPLGEEYIDGEYCDIDEFEVELISVPT